MVAENGFEHDSNIRVTLLGTGTPSPVIDRFGPSTLVQVGGESLIFDAGRGALIRLNQLQPPVKEVRSLFLTHLHSDHLVGLPDLWLTGWLNGRPKASFRVWGPRGTRDMMACLDRAFQFDIRIRLYDDRTPPEGVVVLAEDITEGVVYAKNNIKVTAFEVDHSPVQPAFGYRIDYSGRSVVISGDTRYNDNLIRYAQGTDVLIHEVALPELFLARSPNNPEIMQRVMAHHTTPEQAGEIFGKVQPRLAVFNHILPTHARADDIIQPVCKTYNGRVEAGEDLMVINIGDEVTVKRRANAG